MKFISTCKVFLIAIFLFQVLFVIIHFALTVADHDVNHYEFFEHYIEILRASVSIKGRSQNDSDPATMNEDIVKEMESHGYVKKENDTLKWSSTSHENTDFGEASRVEIYSYQNLTRSSPSQQLYPKEDENTSLASDTQLTSEEINQDDFEADTRQQANGSEVTSREAEIAAIERLIKEKFEKKSAQMKRKLSAQLGHDPLPVQVFTGKRLLTKLLRVPGSESERARKLIADMVVSGMAAQGNISETKLTEVRHLVDRKLRQLAEQLKYRGNRSTDDVMTTTTNYTPSSTDRSPDTNTTSNVKLAATANHHLDQRLPPPDVIIDVSHAMPVIDLSSDEDYSHVLHNGSRVFDLRCRDRLTGVHYRRYMVKLTNYYVIGYISDYITDYAAVSVGITKKSSLRYIFVLPLTVLANRRVGFGSIVILVSTVDNYVNNLGLRHVLSRLCQLGAVVIFLPAPDRNTASVSQTSRIFVANMLLGIYGEMRANGFPVSGPHDKYLVLSDSDMWPLKRSVFSVPGNASILARPVCKRRPIEEGGRVYYMYPLSGIGMRTASWYDVLTTYGHVPPDFQVTAENIVQLFVDRFGQIANKTTRRSGSEESWFLDQRFLSVVIQNYIDEHGEGSVFFLKDRAPRIDKGNWPALDLITQQMVDNAKEVHVIPAESGEKWQQLTPLLEKMYGAYSEEYSWCLDYHNEYTEKYAYLPTSNMTWA